jgi:hypothetical protein
LNFVASPNFELLSFWVPLAGVSVNNRTIRRLERSGQRIEDLATGGFLWLYVS